MTTLNSEDLDFLERLKAQAPEYQKLQNTPPNIPNYDEEIEAYCQHLPNSELAKQKEDVIQYAVSLINPYFVAWRNQFRACDQLRDQISREILLLETDRKPRMEALLAQQKATKITAEQDVNRINTQIELKNNEIANTPMPGKHQLWSTMFFIASSFSMSLLTVFIYISNQGKIETVNKGGDIRELNVFNYILDGGWVWGLGAVAFLVAGKAISFVYEKEMHPKKFFYGIVAILAICFSLFIPNYASLVSNLDEMSRITAGLKQESFKSGLAQLLQQDPQEEQSIDIFCSKDENKKKSQCIENDRKNYLELKIKESDGICKIVTILFDIFISAIGFMKLSEYSYQSSGVPVVLNQQLLDLKSQRGGLEEKIGEYSKKIHEMERGIGNVSGKIAELRQYQGVIPSTDVIASEFDTNIGRCTARAIAILNRVNASRNKQ